MMKSMQEHVVYRILPENDITDALDRSIKETLVLCFPNDASHFQGQRWWHSRHQWTASALDMGGRFIAGLCVVERTISVGGKTVKTAGIGNVCTHPDFRGRGIIDRIMALALEEARTRNLEAGLLFCKPALEKVYNRMGWKRLDARVILDDGAGNQIPPKEQDIVMTIPLLVESFPDGPVNLNGRDW